MKYKSEMVKVNYLDGIRVWVQTDTKYLTTTEYGEVYAHYDSYPRISDFDHTEWTSSIMSGNPVLEVNLEDTNYLETLVDVQDQIKAIVNANNEDAGCWQTFDPTC